MLRLQAIVATKRRGWFMATRTQLAGALPRQMFEFIAVASRGGLRCSTVCEKLIACSTRTQHAAFCPNAGADQSGARRNQSGVHVSGTSCTCLLIAAKRSARCRHPYRLRHPGKSRSQPATARKSRSAVQLRAVSISSAACARETVVFPIHPRTRDAISRFNLETENLCLCPRCRHSKWARAFWVTCLTDSGGGEGG